jgi:hypothetical protein
MAGGAQALAGVNSVTINSVTPAATWFKGTDLPAVVSVTYSWMGTNVTGAALSIGAPPPPLGSPIAVQNISFTADSGTRTDKVPLPMGLPDGKLTIYVVILSSTTPTSGLAQQGQAVWVDKTPPTISVVRYPEPTASGWNNTDVALSFICSDGNDTAQAGVSTCPEPITITGEGANQSVVVASTDLAGNKRLLTVDGINIDKTPPRLNIKTPVAGTIYALTQRVSADWTAVDDWSGIASINVSSAKGSPVDTTSLGMKEFRLSVVDGAGNSASLTAGYQVSYNFKFSSPLKENKMNTVLISKTLQVKFQVLNGQKKPIKNVVATLWYRAADSKGKPTGTEYIQAPAKAPFEGETFAYNGNSAFYFYNVDTQAVGPGYWQFEVRLDDNTTRTVNVFVKSLASRRPSSEGTVSAQETSAGEEITLQVFDARGRLVLSREIETTDFSLATETTLPNGVYFYLQRVRTSAGEILRSELKKFVLVH